MNRKAFRMKLYPGFMNEYKRRHDEIWPDLKSLLKEAEIGEYSIFIDEETHYLFAIFNTTAPALVDSLPLSAIMQQWWLYMCDIMETNEDNSPVSIPLKEVFYLP